MAQVIPAIIAKDTEELEEKIKKVSSYVDWIQLDVMDGRFVDNITWYNPGDLKKMSPDILSGLKTEAHLMVMDPEKVMDKWIDSGIDRIIFHYEATHRRGGLAKEIKDAGLEAGIAIDIVTPVSFIKKFLDDIDLVLVMTVKPGRSGQVFREEVLEKIKELKKIKPDIKIEVDGGINPETGQKAVEAGADILASGSYILESENIEEAINSLKKL